MSGTLVRVLFSNGDEKFSDFETLFEAISMARHEGDFHKSEELKEAVGELDKESRFATKEIIKNKWFWQFNPEFGVGGHELEAVEVEYFIEKNSPEIKELETWAKALGAVSVELESGDFYDEDFE